MLSFREQLPKADLSGEIIGQTETSENGLFIVELQSALWMFLKAKTVDHIQQSLLMSLLDGLTVEINLRNMNKRGIFYVRIFNYL